MRYLLITFLFAITLTAISFAQSPVDKLQSIGIKKLPDVNKILLGEEPITTSLDDAVYEAPELDDFIPANILPANELPRDNDGSFYLFPGVWEFNLKSYCLRAGTYAPSKEGGSGYIYAPLKGPKADIIDSILTNGFKHPEIKQHDIQVLIWAIIARTNFKDMPPEYMVIAAKLLNDQQLLKLNKDVLKNYTQSEFSKLCKDLPAPVQQVLKAENKMRGMLYDPATQYEDLEKVAVLTGVAPETEGRRVPKGRWSLTPEGYYIRYFPNGYSKMVLQVYIKDDMYNAANYTELRNVTAKNGGPLNEFQAPLKKPIGTFKPPRGVSTPDGPHQRLGPSNDKNPDDRNNALDKAKKLLSGGHRFIATSVIKNNPIGKFMFGHILDFNLEVGEKIIDALNSDPPDPNYANFARAEDFDYKGLHEIAFENAVLNQLATDFADAYLDAYALMLALSKSNDKLGGAKLANDKLWMEKQAKAIIFYKKAVGDALLTACGKWKIFSNAFNEDVKIPFTFMQSDVIAYQDKLRTTGFDENELSAFKFLKMSDSDINNLKNQRLAYDYSNYSTSYLENTNLVMSAWKEYGNVYSKFPAIPAPWQ